MARLRRSEAFAKRKRRATCTAQRHSDAFSAKKPHPGLRPCRGPALRQADASLDSPPAHSREVAVGGGHSGRKRRNGPGLRWSRNGRKSDPCNRNRKHSPFPYGYPWMLTCPLSHRSFLKLLCDFPSAAERLPAVPMMMVPPAAIAPAMAVPPIHLRQISLINGGSRRKRSNQRSL